MKAGWLPAAVALALVACGSDGSVTTPSAPSPAPSGPAPIPQVGRMAGVLVDTLTGMPVAGASLAFAGAPAVTTAGDGRWDIEHSGATSRTVVITAPGYVERQTSVRGDMAGRADVRLDLIAERAPFRLDFYRELARDALDRPEGLRSLRRWTQAPRFYVDVTNPRGGGRLTPSEIVSIEQTIRRAVPQMTGGLFQAGIIETGEGALKGQSGYISISFVHEPGSDFCGWAYVGANPGEIVMNYDRCPSSCGRFAPETLAHEIGHALGFYHTSGSGIMHPDRTRRCTNLDFSAEERAHAAIVYARPNGNRDVDLDPPGFAAVEAEAPATVITCAG
jgi:hypothetical protein